MAAGVTDGPWEVVGLDCRLGVIAARGGRKQRTNETPSAVGARNRSASNVSYESMGNAGRDFPLRPKLSESAGLLGCIVRWHRIGNRLFFLDHRWLDSYFKSE